MHVAEVPIKRNFMDGTISTTINKYIYPIENGNKIFEVSTLLNLTDHLFIEKGATEIKNEILINLSILEDNWNGNHAPKFEISLLMKAQTILDSISILPDIFPTARESVQFEYEKEDGAYLEFEIFMDRVEYLLIKSDGEEIESSIEEKEIAKLVKRFHEQTD